MVEHLGAWHEAKAEEPLPGSEPLFDGRAGPVTGMRGHSYGTTSGYGMTPPVWEELAFYEQDITAVPDPRFGKAYRIRLNALSRNPWWVGQPASKPSCEVTQRRPHALGQVDWYAFATRFQAGWQAGSWGVIAQLGYPTLSSPPLAVAISERAGVTRVGIDRHAGIVTSGTSGLLNVEPRFHDLSAIEGRWLDWLLGVKWAVDGTGWVRVETRPEGGAWGVRYEAMSTPTWQQKQGEPPRSSSMDKMGAYQDASALSGPWENVLLNSGLTRWPDEQSARASMG